MIRQAHTYLVGAVSGVTLIAAAIAVFVVLVSAQVFKDWPIAALGGGDDSGAVSKAAPVADTGAKVVPAGAGGQAGGAKPSAVKTAGKDSGAAPDHGGAIATTGGPVTVPTGGGETGSGGGSGTGQGGGGSTPADSPGSNPSTPAASNSAGGNGGAGGGGGGGSTGGGGGSNTAATTTSGTVTETVNGTVGKVDETALGGTLHESGVTGATEGVVNGVAGPESTVGKVVDETVGVVGGLLHGGR